MASDRLRYFAACNSEAGFHSFYRDVFFEDLSHIYIIKGGPGTGKSSLMRRAADRAEAHGYRVEEIYCSSDPASLDGIIAYDPLGENDFAMLDGTAPHIMEMTLPGARDEILYVGDFWSSTALSIAREEIVCDSRARAAGYRRLYRYLQAAGQCERERGALLSEYWNGGKVQDTVSAILTHYPAGRGYHQKTMLTSSIGMCGVYRFSTFEKQADTVYSTRDCGGLSYLFYEEVCRQAKRREMPVWVSYDPLIPTRIDAVYLPQQRLAFVSDASKDGLSENTDIRRLSLRRYVDSVGLRAANASMAMAERCRDRLLGAAFEVLGEIKTLHFSIEARYVAAMDYDTMRSWADRKLSEIIPE